MNLFHFYISREFQLAIFRSINRTSGRRSSVSSSTVVRLKETWQDEYKMAESGLSEQKYVIGGGRNLFNLKLEDERSCILVIMGATGDGKKELIAVEDGFRKAAYRGRIYYWI